MEHDSLRSLVRISLAVILAMTAMLSVAEAQRTQPQVAVPAPDSGGAAGCYRVRGQIYGPYRMTFCLGRQNYYTVTGGGLNCRGGLSWFNRNRNRIEINLQQSRCGQGTNWTADTLRCNVSGGGRGAGATVAVPVPNGGGTLSCRYIPNARGFQPTTITAVRQ